MKNNRSGLLLVAAALTGSAIAYGLFAALSPSLRSLSGTQISSTTGAWALILLTALLVTAFAYAIVLRQNKVLNRLHEKTAEAAHLLDVQASSGMNNPARPLPENLERFIQLAKDKISQTHQASIASQATLHLLTYKQEKAESALNAIPEGVLILDDTCTPTFANPKLEPLLGVSRESMIGRPAPEWCTSKEVLTFLMRFKNVSASIRTTHMEYMPEENSDRRISVAAYPLLSPRDSTALFGMLVIFRDITQEHLARQAGAEFVGHVSHELKTPLNTLATHSELLLDYASLSDNERVEAVNVIHGEVDRMATLVNNLLNISKIETGTMKLNRKRVKMQDLLEDTFNNMHSQALGKGIMLDLKIPADLGSARLDKDMIRIAINNLVSNAIKYSDAGSTVTLGARVLDEDLMQISVKDHGIGISADDQSKIFLKYYRADNASTASRSGHGLGLYLARQIIEMHHGSIAVKSELGKGSEFIITLKAQPVQLEESLST